MDADELEWSRRAVGRAWRDLPPTLRALSTEIRADRRVVVRRPIGGYVDDVRRSAGLEPVDAAVRHDLDAALGASIPELGLVVIDIGHEVFDRLGGRRARNSSHASRGTSGRTP